MPKSRTLIGHRIGRAWHVVVQWYVAVASLVQRLKPQKVGRWTGCGAGAFLVPVDIGDVVGACPDCGFTDVEGACEDVVMGDVSTEFQVTVRDGAGWVLQ